LVRPKNEARGSRALAAPLGALASCARWGAAQVTRQGAQQLDRDGTLGEPCAAVLHEYRWLECAVHQPCVQVGFGGADTFTRDDSESRLQEETTS